MSISLSRNFSAAGVRAAGVRAARTTLALAAAFLATPTPAPQVLAQSIESKPQQVRLDFMQGDKKTGLKLFVERGGLAKVTATDSAGTRSMKRVNDFAVPCPAGEREFRTVELEDGTLIDASYCKGSDAILVALLVPAVQKIREAASRRNQAANSGSGPHVKVFDGTTGAAGGEARKAACWADEKLKLSFCKR